ncbi:hypothetical protein FA09DRAFT_341827 [Tilletiopsis washingtonensis]|uniref:F-box domain-containing protein n=1 Tax=Tilletiopsis washingtonensis TaxID=58919 RepID=A0A316YZD7_9BASI|nr:hypothetical protein FA09DRAFT_341827 [Tilletiopsis washingtonensis]PWN94639.1 hypothetical protein FA09DRAFT_341827 [Tilletiopsis washingtonensis]
MASLLSLPVELRIEVLLYCTPLALRLLKCTCQHLSALIDEPKFDGLMFRTRDVDAALLQRGLELYTARRARSTETSRVPLSLPLRLIPELGWSFLKVKAVERSRTWSGEHYFKLHPLILIKAHFEISYEELPAAGSDAADCDFLASRSEDEHKPRLASLAAAGDNATDPPVSHMTVTDPRTSLETRNYKLVRKSSMVGRFQIHNEDGRPISVEQFWRCYCFYAGQVKTKIDKKLKEYVKADWDELPNYLIEDVRAFFQFRQ